MLGGLRHRAALLRCLPAALASPPGTQALAVNCPLRPLRLPHSPGLPWPRHVHRPSPRWPPAQAAQHTPAPFRFALTHTRTATPGTYMYARAPTRAASHHAYTCTYVHTPPHTCAPTSLTTCLDMHPPTHTHLHGCVSPSTAFIPRAHPAHQHLHCATTARTVIPAWPKSVLGRG